MNKLKSLYFSTLFCSISLGSIGIANAQQVNTNTILSKLSTPGYETLEKIKRTNKIILGYSRDSIPFSYVEANKVYGYSIELCEKSVNKIKEVLGTPNLAIAYQEVTNNNKYDLLISGKIDLECGISNFNDKAYKKIDLSIPYFFSNMKVLTTKNGIKTLKDNNISVNSDIKSKLIEKINLEQNINVNKIINDNNDVAITNLNKNIIDGILLDDVIIQGLLIKNQQSNNFKVLNEVFSINPIGIAMRDNDRIKDIVDLEISSLMNSGELNQIYQKWFLKPIAPKGYLLNINQSPLLKNVINNPTDIVGF